MRGLCENCIHQAVCDFYRQEGADGFTMNCPFHKEERPHGEWIEANSTDLKCSICGHRELKERTLVTFLNYCSLCGADMRKEGD